MARGLVIVESPTKARTIGQIMGSEYLVKASMGHIRDLPEKTFGVSVTRGFEPEYRVIPGKKTVVAELKRLAARHPDVFLATDEDREGEAIAWHAAIAIGRDPAAVKRIAFHEITPAAVRQAFASPRAISMDLVNAQQARRILDRLVGYSLSPLLNRHLQRGLSAGRVQSVALRLVVDREKEIEAFTPRDYWVISALVENGDDTFSLGLASVAGQKVDDESFPTEDAARAVLARLRGGTLTVSSVTAQDRLQYPQPPFVTSTLQQEANSRLGFPSSKTMAVAQQLYEGISLGGGATVGLITYMRTDSPSVARQAQTQAFRHIEKTHGKEYVPGRPPVYQAKLATAQEAHEAIRPTSLEYTPDSIAGSLSKDQAALYGLIFRRFVASQMAPARIRNLCLTAVNGDCGFRGEKNEVLFPGFSKEWPARIDAGIAGLDRFTEGAVLPVRDYRAEGRRTKPPSRYSEATLIRALEKFGIGRPSTYAPTIGTILGRGYIRRERRFLVPEKMGRAVTEILLKFFPDIMETGFTARMEDDLDKVASGELAWDNVLKSFYGVFKPVLDRAHAGMAGDRSFLASLFGGEKPCPKCGAAMRLKRGKYGMFLGCSAYPKCTYTERVAPDARHSRNRFAQRPRRPAPKRRFR